MLILSVRIYLALTNSAREMYPAVFQTVNIRLWLINNRNFILLTEESSFRLKSNMKRVKYKKIDRKRVESTKSDIWYHNRLRKTL